MSRTKWYCRRCLNVIVKSPQSTIIIVCVTTSEKLHKNYKDSRLQVVQLENNFATYHREVV